MIGYVRGSAATVHGGSGWASRCRAGRRDPFMTLPILGVLVTLTCLSLACTGPPSAQPGASAAAKPAASGAAAAAGDAALGSSSATVAAPPAGPSEALAAAVPLDP